MKGRGFDETDHGRLGCALFGLRRARSGRREPDR